MDELISKLAKAFSRVDELNTDQGAVRLVNRPKFTIIVNIRRFWLQSITGRTGVVAQTTAAHDEEIDGKLCK